jgi:hypothetical protein
MNLPHDNLKVVFALLLTGSIAASGFAECGSTRFCTSVAGATSNCAAAECCCCRRTNESRTCCCASKESPPGPTTGSNQAGDGLKWLSWAQAELEVASIIPIGLETTQPSSQLLTPVRRSVQLLLCIWRL